MPLRDGKRVSYGFSIRNHGPFELEKDHERYVEVDGVLGNCRQYAKGSGEFIRVQPVTFEVLRQTLTEKLRLPGTIEFRYRGC